VLGDKLFKSFRPAYLSSISQEPLYLEKAVGGKQTKALNAKRELSEEAFIALTGGEEEIDRFMETAGKAK
jgi:hypothetical protein